jgi:biotin transport system substrate-specific component
MPVRQLVLIALFTALIAVLAQAAVPLPFSPVPVTGQLIAVLLAGTLLGGKGAFLTVLSYLLLGATGAPVFSMGRGGLFILLGPTGGYLWGFLPAAYFSGKLQEGGSTPGLGRTAAAMTLGLGCIYLLGTLQLSLIMGYSAGQAFLAGVAPFIPVDIIKIALAAALGARVRKSLRQSGLLPPQRVLRNSDHRRRLF